MANNAAKTRGRSILLIVLTCCAAMALVESVLRPGYVIKSAIKLLLFGGSVLAWGLRFREEKPSRLFRTGSLGFALLLGTGIYGVILGGYALVRPFMDLESIAANLLSKEHVSRENFLWVALYISLVNSLLEELLFRGFGFLTLRNHWSQRTAGILSAALFSVYHVAILSGWFSWWLFLLCLAGLFVGGLIFNALDRDGSILPSWLAHASANLAINTIGMMMFGFF